LVLAGEICAMFALASTGATCCATEELSVPITPARVSSLASLLAALAPVAGVAASSCASRTTVYPDTVPFWLACLTARSTLFLMPSPSAESGPVSGAITPILTTFLASPPPPPSSLEHPVATIARTTATARPGRIFAFKGLAPFHVASPVTLRQTVVGATPPRRSECSATQATVRRTSHRGVGPGRDGRTVPQRNRGNYELDAV
jgi:hypothetical protein